MDWDDDDEKTAVYDKDSEEDAAKALLRSAPPPAAGMPADKVMKRDKVGAAGAIASASGGTAAALPKAEPRPAPRPVVVPPPEPAAGGRMLVLLAAFVAIAAVAAAVLFVVKPFGKANLVVTVAGPNNDAVDAVEIVIEDVNGTIVRKCNKAQCPVAGIAPGMYIVRASAAGYAAPAPETIRLRAGDNDPYKIVLAKARRGTGIRVASIGPGLRVSIDGHDEGPLPKALNEMKPGTYSVRIYDENGRYEPWEKKVEVKKDKVLALEPKLKVVKGLAIIKPGANSSNAAVHLVTGGERRTLTRLPIKVEITPGNPVPQLVARKKGFHDLVRDISFDDGIAVKTFTLDLAKQGEPLDDAEESPPEAAGKTAVRATTRKPVAPRPATAKRTTTGPARPTVAATGQGTISINSIPVSNVIVDGRPVGSTPTRWSGPPGTHTVVFIHAEYGRKVQSVTVKPGGNSVAAVRFP
jgi:serine/threonine-protein kinase